MTDGKLTSPWDDDPLMAPAFYGFVRYCLTDRMTEYFEETEDTYRPSSDTIGRMIDEATGSELAFYQRVTDWCLLRFGAPEDLEVNQ